MRKKIRGGLLLLVMLISLVGPISVPAKERTGIVNSSGGLYVRQDNSLNSEKIGSLADQTKIIIVSKTKKWYKIRYETGNGSHYGFVLRKYVKLEKSSKQDKKTVKKEESKTETKPDTKTETKKKKEAKTEKEESKDETTVSAKNYQSVIVGADLLNVRADNSKQSDIIATVRALETYPIVSMSKNWVKIALTSDTHGYVMKKYVDFSVLESKDGHEVFPDAGSQQEDQGSSENAANNTAAAAPEPEVLLHASDIEFTHLENKIAVLNAAAVNVRRDTNLESPIMAMLLQGVRLEATGDSPNWIRVSIDDEQGYIMKPYASVEDGVLIYDTIPEGIHIARTEAEIRQPNGSDGNAVVEFAKQFLGNPYSWAGTSLTNGADCSGFVQSVYRRFGYYLKRTSAQQRNDGIPVASLSEAMPGDLICYEGHVGIFAGHDVGLIHASNKRSGIIITRNPSYRPIVAIRRIIFQ